VVLKAQLFISKIQFLFHPSISNQFTSNPLLSNLVQFR